MAKVVTGIDWDSHARQPGPKAKYPWTDWMNGEVWEAVKGTDFDITCQNFVASLHAKARAKGMKCKTRTMNDKVHFQFLQV